MTDVVVLNLSLLLKSTEGDVCLSCAGKLLIEQIRLLAEDISDATIEFHNGGMGKISIRPLDIVIHKGAEIDFASRLPVDKEKMI